MRRKYREMLKSMQKKEKESGTRTSRYQKWFLYILRCRDNSLYTGITKNIKRRIAMHESGKASRYTRSRLPVELCYQESCAGRTKALVRECAIKALPRVKKDSLIKKYTQKFKCLKHKGGK